MAQYMVERHLEGFPPEQLPAAAAAAKAAAAEVDAEYVRSTWVPDGERCYCLFEAPSKEVVAEVQRRAQLPYEAIHDAAFLTAADV